MELEFLKISLEGVLYKMMEKLSRAKLSDFVSNTSNTTGAQYSCNLVDMIVLHPGKGGCADPVNEDAILERVGGGPPGRNKKRELASDTGDGKT